MAPNPSSAAAHVDMIVRRAWEFSRAHSADPAIRDTFGYFTRHPIARLNRRRLVALVERTLEEAQRLGRAPRVLDLACGGGLIAETIASTGAPTLGLDLNEGEIGLAREFARAAQFDTANLIEDPHWEGRVEAVLGATPDVVVLAYALHHLPKVEGFVTRLGSWLPPNALVLVNEENPRSPLFRAKHLYRTWVKRNTDEEWHRTYGGWKRLLVEAHFEVGGPAGHDPIRWLASIEPELCWSLVFAARRRAD
jgi:2-polyprenyl-3-methyl-5-hydroxy-6-metoxy-1,4-benzoquinol methylase